MLIIHGEDQPASRTRFLEIKKRLASSGLLIVELAGTGLTLQELKTKTESISLLGDSPAVFIENIFSGRPGREKTRISEYLLEKIKEEIYIWEPGNVSLQLKNFPPDSIEKYDLPKYIFRFLDHPTYALLIQSLENSAPEQIFSLLVSHFRKLIMVKEQAGIFPSWQLQKLKSQAAGFSLSHLISLYKELLEIDYCSKTSSSSHNLAFSLELWLARL